MAKFTKDDIGKEVVLVANYDGLQPGSTGIVYEVLSNGCRIKNVKGKLRDYCYDCDSYECSCEEVDERPYSTSSWFVKFETLEFVSISTNNLFLLLI